MARPISTLLKFFLIATSIASSAAWYTGIRLNSALPLNSPWRLAVWGMVVLIWAFPIARIFMASLGKEFKFQNAGFYLLGIAASLLVTLLIFDVLRLALSPRFLSWPTQMPLLAAGLCLGFSLLGWRMALQGPAVKTIRLPIENLHPDLVGLSIAQISDLHIGSMLGRNYVKRVVDQLMALKPDLIAITGDLIDGPLKDLQDAIVPLYELKANLGVHYVTGNHEYIWGVKEWVSEFKQMGFQVLDNAHRALSHTKAKILVVGINDLSAGRFGSTDRPDVLAAIHGAPESDFTLFLAHQPQAYLQAEKIHCDLMLAGHTHAGQFLPMSPIVSLFHRYFKGLYRHQGKFWIYVNAGTGFWGPPSRLGVPTEITLFELVRA